MDRHQEHWLKKPEWKEKKVEIKKKRNSDFIVFGMWSLIVAVVLFLITFYLPYGSDIRTAGFVCAMGNFVMGYLILVIGIG